MPALDQPAADPQPPNGTALTSIAWAITRAADEVPDARHRVHEIANTVLGYGDDRDNADLAATELIANAVKHGAGGTIGITVTTWTATLRVEVHDCGTPPDPTAVHTALTTDPADTTTESGRGLFLVDTFADRWGYADGPGTTAWFEIDRKADQ